MKKGDYYRGVEDPISGTLRLAEEISSKSDSMLYYSVFALIFVMFGMLVIFLLLLVFLNEGNLFMALIFVSVFATGIITLKLLMNLREFLKKVSIRYAAIKAMKDGSPTVKVPAGRNPTERFLKYLRRKNGALVRLLKRRPEVLSRDSYIVGKGGKRHHFHAFILMRASLLYRLIRKGHPGYILLIREYKRGPTEKELMKLLSDLRSIRSKQGLHPNRVVMLFKAGSAYRGLDEAVYERIVEEKVDLAGKGRSHVNLQAVAELKDGSYEFIPFIPELPNLLP